MDDILQQAERMLSGFNSYVGIRIISGSCEHFEIEAQLSEDMLNSDGVAHGGFLFTLCDAVCGFLARADGRRTVTQSANIYFLRQGRGKTLRAVSRVIRAGRSTGLYEAEVYDETGVLISKGTCSMFFFTPPASSVPG